MEAVAEGFTVGEEVPTTEYVLWPIALKQLVGKIDVDTLPLMTYL